MTAYREPGHVCPEPPVQKRPPLWWVIAVIFGATLGTFSSSHWVKAHSRPQPPEPCRDYTDYDCGKQQCDRADQILTSHRDSGRCGFECRCRAEGGAP